MIAPRIMSRYILVKKSSLLLGGLVVAGILACHYYRRHHSELKQDFERMTDEVADAAKDVAKKGGRKVQEMVDDAKS